MLFCLLCWATPPLKISKLSKTFLKGFFFRGTENSKLNFFFSIVIFIWVNFLGSFKYFGKSLSLLFSYLYVEHYAKSLKLPIIYTHTYIRIRVLILYTPYTLVQSPLI